jgi:hypothetical protein
MSSPLYRDAALADSSRLTLREEEDGSRSTSTKTILATVLGIIPAEISAQEKQLAPPPVELETDDDGVRRRPTYKDSFGSVRPLAAAPTVEPLIQPPAHNNASAPDEMDTGAVPPRLTYIDSVGRIRTLAQVVASVTPTQNNESAPDATDTGATRRLVYKDSFGSVRFPAAAMAAVRTHTQKNETAPDEDEAVRIRRPTYMDRADTHPSTVASMPPRVPLAQDNATTLDAIETGAVCRPMYKDCFGSAIPPLSAAKIPPIANVPQMKKPKEVDEVSDTFYDEHELNEDEEAGSDNKRARVSGEWIMVLPESKKRRGWTCCMTLLLVVIGTVVAIVFGGICGNKGCRIDPVSPQPPTSKASQDENPGNSQVSIEVQHDLRPEETGWMLRDSTGELIASQSTGSFRTGSGTVFQKFDVAVGTYTFEMTDTFGDGICCMDGSGSFQITVNGETVVSNDGQFGDTVQETFEATTPNS